MSKFTIAKEVLATRTALGLSQPELASLIGVHQLTVSKWERGVLVPSDYQQKLLHAIRAGILEHKVDVKAWLRNTGPIPTLAYLIATAFHMGPRTVWRPV